MRRRGTFILIPCFILAFFTGIVFATESNSPLLTLEDALARVSYHGDYQSLLEDMENVDKTISDIFNQEKLTLDLDGNILSYNYNINDKTGTFSSSATFGLSKSNLKGTKLTGSLNPTYNVGKSENSKVNTSWRLALTQTIWPSPKLSNDQISLTVAKQKGAILQSQENYVLANALLKIEELYHRAQVAEARVEFAKQNLAQAQRTFEITEKKRQVGEAGETDLIGAQIGVLRAERELEASLDGAQVAKKNLLEALDLDGDYRLSSLNLEQIPQPLPLVELGKIKEEIENHPLVQDHISNVHRAQLELAVAQERKKPNATLRLSIEGPGTSLNEKTFVASVNIGHAILDGNKRKDTISTREEDLKKMEDAYENAVDSLLEQIEQEYLNVHKLARDWEIAELTLKQAQLELEGAKQKFAVGIIDQAALENVQIRHQQAQLDYYEAAFSHNLAVRRLNWGILGDLPSVGGLR